MKKFIALLISVLAILATAGTPSANAVVIANDSFLLWSPLGSGHQYTGSFNSCSGALVGSGTTNGVPSDVGPATYSETVTGNYNNSTGVLSIKSVYDVDPNTGYVNDSLTLNSAYSYTMTGTVGADNWYSGSYTITKTPVGGVPETYSSDFSGIWFQVGDVTSGSCPPPPVLDAGNHGQCVSSAAAVGIKGQSLAAIAKVVTKVGAYGSATCPKV